MFKKIAVTIGLLSTLMFGDASVNAKLKHTTAATGAAKVHVHVHVLLASGKPAGRAHVTLRRTGHPKPRIGATAGPRGNYTSGAIPAGSYTITARKSGHGSGKAALSVTGAGMHNVTVHLGKARTAVYSHVRVLHKLGTTINKTTKAAAKSVEAPIRKLTAPAHSGHLEKNKV